jgi:hypothetical protein
MMRKPVDLVSYSVKAPNLAQDNTNWLIDRSTCKHRCGAQCGRL